MTRSIARHFAFDDHKKSHCRKITTQRQQFADEVVTRYIGIPSSGHFQNLIQQEFPRQETQNYANIVPIFLGKEDRWANIPLDIGGQGDSIGKSGIGQHFNLVKIWVTLSLYQPS